MSESERIKQLGKELILLSSLGEVITLQIDLIDIDNCQDILSEAFTDSEGDGLFINDMILIRVFEDKFYNFSDILDKIVESTGDYETIDSVTALIRVYTGSDSLEMTVSVNGQSDYPNLLQSTNNQLYFQLVHMIQTKWLMAKKAIG
ncbi:MAG: hypothetical protein INQ03_12320 [Candidatus Heimdallarchaeota archaeon]|nr:hypothetical protein [Candidatus Heimdallarchaeota archaeon]